MIEKNSSDEEIEESRAVPSSQSETASQQDPGSTSATQESEWQDQVQ
jgi:hypothetical protein